MRTWLICPLMLAALTGCLSDDEVVGSGKFIVRELEAVPFSHVVFSSNMGRLYIEQGEKSSFRIETDDNIADLFVSEVVDGTLTIRLDANKRVAPTRPIKVYATMKKIESIAASGNGAIQSHGELKVDKLDVKLAGSGSVNLDIKGAALTLAIAGSGDADIKGEVRRQSVKIEGSGSYHGQDLLTKEADLSISGSGSALVNVDEKLDVSLHGSGTVRYSGHPKITQKVEGSGAVIPMK